MIIFKYLAKEIYSVLLAITGILLLTFLCNAFIRYLTQAASGKISAAIVFKILLIQIPTLLGLLLPASLFLTFLAVYGRLYADNEMTVLTACGMSRLQLLKHSLNMSIFIMLLDIVLVFFVSPVLMQYQENLLSVSPQQTILQTLQPGRFQVANQGKNVVYIESINEDNQLKNIFVAQREKEKPGQSTAVGPVWNVLSATAGYSTVDEKTGQLYVIATQGYRYFGVPGQKNFKILKFSEYGAKVNTTPQKVTYIENTLSLQKLWQIRKTDSRAMAELEWRFSIPLSLPVLIFLAVPMSRIKPREGRYAQLLPAILIYAIYANMMFVAKSWVEHEKIPVDIGMWWLPLALTLFALWYWVKPMRWLRRQLKRRRQLACVC